MSEPIKIKRSDDRPPRGGWAPGLYMCRCVACEQHFTSDKRAIECADCAYAKPDPPPRPARVSTENAFRAENERLRAALLLIKDGSDRDGPPLNYDEIIAAALTKETKDG